MRIKTVCVAAAMAVAGALGAGQSLADEIAGHLGRSDPRLDEGQYYDDYAVELSAGQALKFTITMAELAPYAIFISPEGEKVEHTQGVYGAEGYSLGTTWAATSSGTWHLIVTAAYPDEIDYTLSYEIVAAP